MAGPHPAPVSLSKPRLAHPRPHIEAPGRRLALSLRRSPGLACNLRRDAAFTGTDYKAAHRQYLGDTQGRGKLDTLHRHTTPIKSLLDLSTDARPPAATLQSINSICHDPLRQPAARHTTRAIEGLTAPAAYRHRSSSSRRYLPSMTRPMGG